MGSVLAKDELTEEDLDQIHIRSKMPKDEILLWHEHFMRECPSGKMDKEKFVEYYSKFRTNIKINDIADRVFAVFDTDKNGTIEFNEFLVAYVVTSNEHGDQDQRKRLNYVFELYDLDNNKVLDEHEIRQVIKIMFKLLGVDQHNIDFDRCIENIMNSLDANHDKKVTKKEFIDGILNDSFLYSLLSPFS